MVVVRFKQKCRRCRKNWVTVSRGQRYAACYDCQKNDLKGTIKDKVFKKMFNIPHEFYVENAFLRDIKVQYLQFGRLTERQIEAFKKVAEKVKEEKKEEKKNPPKV